MAGSFNRPSAISAVEKYSGLVAFGRNFIANVSAFSFIIHQLETNLMTIAQSSLAP
jgi:hypothetical protein